MILWFISILYEVFPLHVKEFAHKCYWKGCVPLRKIIELFLKSEIWSSSIQEFDDKYVKLESDIKPKVVAKIIRKFLFEGAKNEFRWCLKKYKKVFRDCIFSITRLKFRHISCLGNCTKCGKKKLNEKFTLYKGKEIMKVVLQENIWNIRP